MQTIYLDISNKGVIPCIQAKQSEVGRKFLAIITDNGVPYNIPENSLLSVWYEGDTDAGNYSSIEEKSAFSIEGNKVSVELVAQMLLKPGNGELCLSITHGDGGETNTWNIPYCVEYKPGAGSAVPTEYYTALTEAGAEAAKHATNAKIDAEIAAKYGRDFLLMVYPVGSIYMSVSNIKPGDLFGGVWDQIKDKFLLSAGDSHTAGETGGEVEHTLTVDEMPVHSHSLSRLRIAKDVVNSESSNVNRSISAEPEWWYETNPYDIGSISPNGGGKPHNNMPPYLTVYMWKRIA